MKSLEMRLTDIVLNKTKPGSAHQREALKMLNSHLQRFACEIKPIECDRCHRSLECVRWIDKEKNRTVDTWGYLEADKNLCHRCLDEGYIGDIYVPPNSRP